MKRKAFYFLVCFLFLISLFSAYANGLFLDESHPYYTFGQQQYYSVIFDNDGKASIVAKIITPNLKDESMQVLELEIPGKEVRIIYAVQEYYNETRTTCASWQETCTNITDDVCYSYAKNCKEYREERIGLPKYQLVNYRISENTESVKYTLELPREIPSRESSTLILYYRTKDYAKQKNGAFNFDFETIISDYDTNKVRVSVSVTPGLYLKGTENEDIDYMSEFSSVEQAVVETLRYEGGVENSALNYFSDRITYMGDGGFVKTTIGLEPLETFHVKGIYATSLLALYRTTIIIITIIILIFLTGIYFFIQKLRKLKTKSTILKAIGAGFSSAVAIFILWFGSGILMKKLSPIIAYPFISSLSWLLLLVIGIVALILLFGIPIYVGIKYGIKRGILSFVVSLLSLFFLIGIIIILLKAFGIAPFTIFM